jgi:rhodanese-related sulfurtransferase
MGLLREIVGGMLIIAVAGLIGIAQNTVRDDSITLVPKAARAVAKTSMTPQPSVETSVTDDGPTGAGEETTSGWPSEAELLSGELNMGRLRTLMDSENIVLVDARSVVEYAAGRIAGAINIPYDDLIDHYEQLKAKLALDATIVCYCQSVTCDQSESLAKELRFMGYTNVLVYRGGWEEWESAGYPVEGTSSVEQD